MKKIVFALHGFLGRPEDWSAVKSPHTFVAVDYMRIPQLKSQSNLASWGRAFNSWVENNFPPGDRILLGYSMGGRLALQALQDQPHFWQHTVLLSTNPGLKSEKSRLERLQNDEQWAQRFLQLPWPQLMFEWNAQNVFTGSVREPSRLEKDFDRNELAQTLRNWSLARQNDFLSSGLPDFVQTTWLAGERDQKFKDLLDEVGKFPWCRQTKLVAGASHRILFDQPQEISKTLAELQ